jgi:hypothetical protein
LENSIAIICKYDIIKIIQIGEINMSAEILKAKKLLNDNGYIILKTTKGMAQEASECKLDQYDIENCKKYCIDCFNRVCLKNIINEQLGNKRRDKITDLSGGNMNIKLIEELDINTDIEWWNNNRKRLNKVIYAFNEWQTIHKFDKFEKEVVIARVKACREYGEEHEFSNWQFEILDDIENWINLCNNN